MTITKENKEKTKGHSVFRSICNVYFDLKIAGGLILFFLFKIKYPTKVNKSVKTLNNWTNLERVITLLRKNNHFKDLILSHD